MGEKSVAQILREARELISDPKRWTQGKNARDVNDQFADPIGPAAVCWCAEGAIRRVVAEDWYRLHSLLATLNAEVNDAIHRFNDSHTHTEVLAAFDRAIELAEAE